MEGGKIFRVLASFHHNRCLAAWKLSVGTPSKAVSIAMRGRTFSDSRDFQIRMPPRLHRNRYSGSTEDRRAALTRLANCLEEQISAKQLLRDNRHGSVNARFPAHRPASQPRGCRRSVTATLLDTRVACMRPAFSTSRSGIHVRVLDRGVGLDTREGPAPEHVGGNGRACPADSFQLHFLLQSILATSLDVAARQWLISTCDVPSSSDKQRRDNLAWQVIP